MAARCFSRSCSACSASCLICSSASRRMRSLSSPLASANLRRVSSLILRSASAFSSMILRLTSSSSSASRRCSSARARRRSARRSSSASRCFFLSDSTSRFRAKILSSPSLLIRSRSSSLVASAILASVSAWMALSFACRAAFASSVVRVSSSISFVSSSSRCFRRARRRSCRRSRCLSWSDRMLARSAASRASPSLRIRSRSSSDVASASCWAMSAFTCSSACTSCIWVCRSSSAVSSSSWVSSNSCCC
mmetsp:Transcript_56723/g.151317  ORF Transcript_56723/g.151317 Transcript_56723/m.151317 type:complete len:250 (-) Transcript_56723:1501-2250(-)